jgi:hypothetical protein
MVKGASRAPAICFSLSEKQIAGAETQKKPGRLEAIHLYGRQTEENKTEGFLAGGAAHIQFRCFAAAAGGVAHIQFRGFAVTHRNAIAASARN